MRHGGIFGFVYGSESECHLTNFRDINVVLMLFQIFVRAFDLDERLVGVAFLDVGVFVTSLRSVKNLLVIGDAVKSVWFVAFQVSNKFSIHIRYLVEGFCPW